MPPIWNSPCENRCRSQRWITRSRVPRGPSEFLFLSRDFQRLSGRPPISVAVDDIKKVAVPVILRFVSTNFQAQAEGKTSESIIEKLLEIVKEPDVEKYEKKK